MRSSTGPGKNANWLCARLPPSLLAVQHSWCMPRLSSSSGPPRSPKRVRIRWAEAEFACLGEWIDTDVALKMCRSGVGSEV